MTWNERFPKWIVRCAAVASVFWSIGLWDEPKKPHIDVTRDFQSSSVPEDGKPFAISFSMDPDTTAEQGDNIIFASSGTLEEVQWDELAPYAWTASALTIQAQLYTNGAFLDYSDAVASTASFARTRAIASNYAGFPAAPGHAAGARGYIAVSPVPQLIPGGVSLATITTTHQTAAIANSSEPYAAKAIANSQGGVTGIAVQGTSTCQPNVPLNSLLNIAWNVHHLNLTAKPTVAFAFMRDTVDVIQQVNGQISATRLGFVIYVENGKVTQIPINTTGDQSIATWMQQNLQQTDVGVSGAGTFDIPIVVMDPCDPNKSTVLSIQNTHTEAAFEVPPRAVPQTGNMAGFAPDEFHPDANVHWDTSSQTLSFDSVPVNVLTDGRGRGAEYHDNPLNGGTIEIDPALRFTSYDKREYFAGDKLQLYDHDGNLLLQASLPTLVYEDSLQGDQEFDLFGPILNIEYAKKGTSPWLDTFLNEINFTSDLIPELFVDLLSDDVFWNQPFDIQGQIILSFATPFRRVSEPESFFLFFLNLLVLLCFCRKLARQRKTKTPGH